ncbi:hypothetical protein [Nostoc sp. FACHB-190]|uniref:hypothetical protein n=2 Tax=Nostocaceae TaxID=1162 RepID=UPI0016829275|nr:hypothetical protein [Nostoc sp. FACHB-190]MBD2303215.1 hypothetical protein [Nostoc sp. FACHB-190]
MTFKPFSRNNPCPVCGKADTDCRYSTDDSDFILCHTFVDARKGEKVHGFVCVKQSNGHTASFKPDNSREWTEEQQQEWQQNKAQREALAKAIAEQQKQQERERSFSVGDRHQSYLEILDSCSQDERLITYLQQKSFTPEEIAKCGFKSVIRYQPLPRQFDNRLPGVTENGKRLIVKGDGYLCPVRDFDGHIVGLQLRLYNPGENEGRYRWVNTPGSSHQILRLVIGDDLENPLAVFHPTAKPKGIALAEGTGAKPFLSSQRLDLLTIGASGGQFASSPKLLEAYLNKALAQVGGNKKLVIFPDAGDVQNRGVVNRWKKLAELLNGLGWDFQFGWWGQLTKNDADIDELHCVEYSKIQYISAQDFFSIADLQLKLVEKQKQAVNEATEKCEDENSNINNQDKALVGQGFSNQEEPKGYVTKIRKSPEWLNWIDKNKYTPDITLNCQGDLVLPDTLMDIENKNLVIKSPLGTNKTGEALRLIKQLENVYNSFNGNTGIYTTILGYINSLLHQTIDRARGYGIDILHVQSDDDGKLLAKDTSSHIAGCVHSLPHFDGHSSGKAVMVDEIESVLATLVTGSNLGSKHGEIIEMFFRAVRASYGNTFLDGNMTDLSADLIEKITGKKSVKVLNRGQIRRKKFKFIISVKKGKNGKNKILLNDPSPLIKMILGAVRQGKKVLVTTDSRIFGEGLAENAITITADERSAQQLVDTVKTEGYQVFVISKNTSGTEEGKAFLSNPGEYITKNNISLVIGTPSIGSGVSIQLPEGFEDYFDAQFTLFCGVLSTKQQKQILARLRNNKLTHYVYCPIKSLVKDRNRPQQYSATEFFRELSELQSLNRAMCLEQIKRLFDYAMSRINPIFDEYSAELGVLDNFEQDNLLECLSYSLETEGHEVECIFLDPNEQAKNEMKEAKEKIRGREAVEFYKSTPFDSTLDADNQVKANPTPENHLRRSKTYFVKETVPGIENREVWGIEFIREFVIDDSPQYKVKAITREWLLRNPEIAFENHNIKTIRKIEKRYVTSKDLLPGDYGKIWALNQLKFLERVVDAEQFTCKSPNIQQLVNEYRERKDLQRLLKIEPPKDKVRDTTIQDLIIPMLNLLGMKTEEQRRIKVDGVARTAYKAVSAIDEKSRIAIYECLTDKFTKQHEKHELDKMLESCKIQEELVSQIQNQQSTVDGQEQTDMNQKPMSHNSPTENDIDAWLADIPYLVECLELCEAPEMLAELRSIIPAAALKAAAQYLPQQKKQIIKQWVLMYN